MGYRRQIRLSLVVALVFLSLIAASCGGETTSSGGDLGTAGNIGGLLWTFENVSISGESVKVKFKVKNPQQDNDSASLDDVKFIGGNGAEYDPGGLSFGEDLQPGASKDFEAEYEVPDGAHAKEGYVKVGVTAGDDEFVDVGLGAPPPTDAQMEKAFYTEATPEALRLGDKREISSKNCSRDGREFDCFFTTSDRDDVLGFNDEDLSYRVKVESGGRWTARLTTDNPEVNRDVPKTLSGDRVESGLEPADGEAKL